MSKVKLDVGATVDFLTKGELDDSLAKIKSEADAAEQANVRGIKFMTLPVLLYGTAVSGTLNLGSTGNQQGPKDGYAWSVKRVHVQGLGTSDVAQLFRGNQPIWDFSGSVGANQKTFGRLDCVFRAGDYIKLNGVGSLVSTLVITLNADVIEVPAEMLGKLA